MVLPNTATCEGVSAGELHQKVALIEYNILSDNYQISFSCFGDTAQTLNSKKSKQSPF